ncbi:hypothetical protein MCAP1_003381 [Malassezia caprae]|uniref:Plasma membrane iron permease n=1 Tax=Malassezia caprae TaxID=1381934 RepID=A0AAF0EA24_9BASI|nr:hypothetical protein MCAP1_003381 [Malassezia caprae]
MSSGPAGNRVFAPTIFFIAFREALEAALVIGILAGMIERVIGKNRHTIDEHNRRVIRKLRWFVIAGALLGLLIAFIIGAVFLAVFYTQATDLYARSEELWEGIFNLIAVVLITPMALVLLQADKSREKWRKKLSKALNGLGEVRHEAIESVHAQPAESASGDGMLTPLTKAESDGSQVPVLVAPAKRSWGTKVCLWVRILRKPFEEDAKGPTAMFVIPLVTTLREGLEGMVFIGGVSLGLPASSIPLPTIVGVLAGLLVGFVIYRSRSISSVKPFLVFSTCALLLIDAGMFSRSVYYFQFYRYVQQVGDAAAESGSGAGSYDARNYIWHLDCCNPEDKTNNGGSGWAILNSLVGWNNTATLGTILAYILFWVAIAVYVGALLIYERRKRIMQKQS